MIPNMEVINLKMELAKERALNSCLEDEILSLKRNFEKEIFLLQETIDMQKKIILEFEEKNVLKNQESEVLTQSVDNNEMESDLLDEAWVVCTEDDLEDFPGEEKEEFKIILELAKEVDGLKSSLADADNNIKSYQVNILFLTFIVNIRT